jgi:hypothetical protein
MACTCIDVMFPPFIGTESIARQQKDRLQQKQEEELPVIFEVLHFTGLTC